VELLFRKYFWTINLAFLAMAAFLVAKTANVYTGNQLLPPPDFAVASTSLRPAYVAPAKLDENVMSRVTGIKLPPKEVAMKEPVEKKDPELDLAGDPVHTGLHVRLQGTTIANDPRWSWAVIEDTQAHTNDTFMVEDKVQTARIIDIVDDCSTVVKALANAKFATPDKPERSKPCVLVLNNNRREYIDDKEGNGPAAPPVVVASAPVVASNDPSSIKATSENEYDISRAEVDKTLSNLNDVAMQARIVPAFKDGVATGFKLFSIRPDSIYSKIGIQNGDVIRRINGFEINSPDKALEAYSKLREAGRIEIEVERNGSVVRKAYNVH
jgi:general secretion pathway protein C